MPVIGRGEASLRPPLGQTATAWRACASGMRFPAMTEQREYWVSYVGELTAEDRDALTRPGWKLYENAVGATGAFMEQELAPVEWRQIVRLDAASSDEARRLIIDALGREPDDLRTDPEDG
jgi:hypothetical protein